MRVTVRAAAVGPVDCQVRSGSKGDELTAAEAVACFEAGGVRGKVGLAGGTEPAQHTEAGLRFTLTGR
ncbi:hypothetical protein SUDANB145_01812 [Streptomyces sp. enrichment culture]|uniref:hypothetical protein n=1 Tax=Streptomyces sp. enrichment culture TaxID=1795815 RepID=UPI003F57844A